MVPLVFVLMTRRRAVDYIAVLNQIIVLVREHSLEEIQCDFEYAIWAAVRSVFGTSIKINGCNFHWSQCHIRAVISKKMKNIQLRNI